MNGLTTFRNLALLAMVLTALGTSTSSARAQDSGQYCVDIEVEYYGETISCSVCTYDDSPCWTWSCPGQMGVACPQ